MHFCQAGGRYAARVALVSLLLVAASCRSASQITAPSQVMRGRWTGVAYPANNRSASTEQALLITILGPDQVSMSLDGVRMPVWRESVGMEDVSFLCGWAGHEYRMTGHTDRMKPGWLGGDMTPLDGAGDARAWEANLN
jgi:hypothetical protein